MKRANKLLFVLLVVLISLINMPLQGFLLGNQYENEDETLVFDLPEEFDIYNKYLLAVHKNSETHVVLPISNNTLFVSTALTSHSGEWYMHVMCKESALDLTAEQVDLNTEDGEHVFISGLMAGIVNPINITGNHFKNNAIDSNLLEIVDGNEVYF